MGSHSSRPSVARWLQRPTREQREPRSRSPIWPCSGWGLACRFCYQKRGGLLPGGLATVRALAGHAPFHHRLIRRPPATRARLCSLRPQLRHRPLADYSLWHFPSPRGVRSLTGILLCGARTFLYASELHSDCPASFVPIVARTLTRSFVRAPQTGHSFVIVPVPLAFARAGSTGRNANQESPNSCTFRKACQRFQLSARYFLPLTAALSLEPAENFAVFAAAILIAAPV